MPRRQALASLAASTSWLACGGTERRDEAPLGESASGCEPTPSQIEGPFFVDTGLVRRDIRDGQPGVPLELELQLVAAGSCEPVAGCELELWHADAAGVYSAFGVAQGNLAEASAQRFLRGQQLTDASGRAAFSTIYPGWYPGRTAHLHLMVLRAGRTLLTTQLYFPDEVSDAVYRQEPYAARGPRDTTNTRDALASRVAGGLEHLLVEIAPLGTGHVARVEIAVGSDERA